MKLLDAFEELFMNFEPHFARSSTFQRAYGLACAHVATFGRRTISRTICSKNELDRDWSADYKFFSCRKWNPNDLFFELLKECERHSHWYQDSILVAMDETFRSKTAKKIPQVMTLRDPMSPPFHVNLTSAIRFLQISAIINPQKAIEANRAIPIYLQEAAPAKKPKKNASDEAKQQYKQLQKLKRITVVARQALLQLRQQVDNLPNGPNRRLIVGVDGSFCNRNFMYQPPANTTLIVRARKDLKLHTPFEQSTTQGKGRYRIYGDRLPTPNAIRTDESYPWQTASIFAAGKYHQLRFKSIAPVLWQKGTGPQQLRLIVIAPLAYRKTKNSKLLYRNPAYLLVTDTEMPDEIILQSYFPRWDIEVNHRDEKSLFGLGDGQVRSPLSVERNPQFTVLAYSTLLLAGTNAYGPFRTDDYLPLPKWRKNTVRRSSTLDNIAQFRREIMMNQLEKKVSLLKTEESENKKRYKKSKKRPGSNIEANKKGFTSNSNRRQKHLKLPVSIISALLYADS